MEFLAGLHPMVVHFPIALLIIYSILEIFGVVTKKNFLTNAAYLILVLGIVGAVAAVLTGNQAEEVAEIWQDKGALIPFGAITTHENYATFTLWFYIFVVFIRTYFVVRKKFTLHVKYAFIGLSIIGILLLYKTAKEGGELVFEHGVGTELLKPETLDTNK
jgi:uncharacterized membrane protein